MNLNEESNRTVGLPLQGVGSPYKFYHISPYLSSLIREIFPNCKSSVFFQNPVRFPEKKCLNK